MFSPDISNIKFNYYFNLLIFLNKKKKEIIRRYSKISDYGSNRRIHRESSIKIRTRIIGIKNNGI